MTGLGVRECGYWPTLRGMVDLAKSSGLGPEVLAGEAYASASRAEVDRAEAELKADKQRFCDQAWARYGRDGTEIHGLLTSSSR